MPFPILAVLAGAQAVYGAIKGNQASKDFNAAKARETPYKTPEELQKILQATQANAQGGFDAETLDYLTTQNDRAFSASLGANQRLGGNANDAAALFDQQMQSIMKVGAQNHALNLENFSRYLGALNTIADSEGAEWSSEQNIVKNELQAANANRQAAFGNIQSAINTGIAAYSEAKMDDLYDPKNPSAGKLPKIGATRPRGAVSSIVDSQGREIYFDVNNKRLN